MNYKFPVTVFFLITIMQNSAYSSIGSSKKRQLSVETNENNNPGQNNQVCKKPRLRQLYVGTDVERIYGNSYEVRTLISLEKLLANITAEYIGKNKIQDVEHVKIVSEPTQKGYFFECTHPGTRSSYYLVQKRDTHNNSSIDDFTAHEKS